MRLALKLATGAGKTTVMAMLIAWQTINAVRRPEQQEVHPRLPGRHARPHHPGPAARAPAQRPGQLLRTAASWCPATCWATSNAPRSSSPTTTPSSCASAWSSRRAAAPCCRAGARSLNTLETEGQMLQRVMPDLMGMKNILVLNDEAHHCYREKPGRGRRGRPEGRRQEGGREEQRGRPPLDLRPRSRQPQARRRAGHRPVGDAVLPARLRLCRGHAVPLDDERLLADGRHRVRHRQAAARAGGRQHPRRGDAHVPQPLGAHRQEDAEEGPGQGQDARPAQPARRAADRARSALRPLREDLRALGGGRHPRAALLHRRLQQHVHLQAGLRLHLRLPPRERGRLDDARERPPARCSATSTSTATRSPGPTRC